MSPWTNVGLTPAVRAAFRASARSGDERSKPVTRYPRFARSVVWRGAPAHRVDLRPHAPGRELALGEVFLRRRSREPIGERLARFAETQGDLGRVRRDPEVLPPDRFRQDGGREVLVDHRLDADQRAILSDDRDPTATRRDHEASLAIADERADDVLLADVHRPWGRNDPPPAPTLVVRHLPSFRFLHEDFVVT